MARERARETEREKGDKGEGESENRINEACSPFSLDKWQRRRLLSCIGGDEVLAGQLFFTEYSPLKGQYHSMKEFAMVG